MASLVAPDSTYFPSCSCNWLIGIATSCLPRPTNPPCTHNDVGHRPLRRDDDVVDPPDPHVLFVVDRLAQDLPLGAPPYGHGLELSPAARRDLDRTATWLATNGRARVLVEGYSDQRGDARPNQALAERRASSIRDYLVTQGVDGDRITTVTYAVPRPVCQEALETCWVQNRRAVVRVTR